MELRLAFYILNIEDTTSQHNRGPGIVGYLLGTVQPCGVQNRPTETEVDTPVETPVVQRITLTTLMAEVKGKETSKF